MAPSNPPSRIVWQGNSWRLRVDSISPTGKETIEKGIIEHPGSVVLVPLRETEAGPEILMLRQYRLTLQSTILELPAGTRGWQEPWLDCAQRELREETGFRAKNFQELGHCWPAPGLTNEVMAIYLARNLKRDPLPQDGDEIIEVQPVLLTELVKMALDAGCKTRKVLSQYYVQIIIYEVPEISEAFSSLNCEKLPLLGQIRQYYAKTRVDLFFLTKIKLTAAKPKL